MAGGVRVEPGLRFRRPVEADDRRLVAPVDEWWGGRQLHHLLPRPWLQHFDGLPEAGAAG